MSRRRLRLTPGLAAQIAAGVRSGSFPQVAAQAFGVAAPRFEEWLKRGGGGDAREPYRALAATIEQAAAQARLRAEMTVLAEEPKAWLLLGPGRERDDAPGWTAPARPGSGAAETDAFKDNTVATLVNAIWDHDSFTLEIKEQFARLVRECGQREAA